MAQPEKQTRWGREGGRETPPHQPGRASVGCRQQAAMEAKPRTGFPSTCPGLVSRRKDSPIRHVLSTAVSPQGSWVDAKLLPAPTRRFPPSCPGKLPLQRPHKLFGPSGPSEAGRAATCLGRGNAPSCPWGGTAPCTCRGWGRMAEECRAVRSSLLRSSRSFFLV